ncbi:unnamed protein product [Peniophora sp. CBMAI 1063]|nr:unnamed protein product [Peniophora sp. CBMAI 1063]
MEDDDGRSSEHKNWSPARGLHLSSQSFSNWHRRLKTSISLLIVAVTRLPILEKRTQSSGELRFARAFWLSTVDYR